MPCVRNESLRDNINAAKTLVIILIVFFVCWFPFFLTYILSFVGKVSRIAMCPTIQTEETGDFKPTKFYFKCKNLQVVYISIISIICDLVDNVRPWVGRVGSGLLASLGPDRATLFICRRFIPLSLKRLSNV